MIRRDVRLDDGAPGWVLVSQIEHARISAELAAHCLGRFGPSAPIPHALRTEVLEAIARHDDGWMEWEQAPQLDPKSGRPVSFMELELADSLAIWSRSIDVASSIGPLAAWMVAGHFARLLAHSVHAKENVRASEWLAGVERDREDRLAAWQVMNPAVHTRDLADEALQWLRTFDEASLWLCRHGLPGGDSDDAVAAPYCCGAGTPIEMELAFLDAKVAGDPTRCTAIASPWRFGPRSLAISVEEVVAPVARYLDWREFLDVSSPQVSAWRLTGAP